MTEEEDKRRIGIAHLILRLRRIGIIDQRVLGAIESVPRTVFVPRRRAEPKLTPSGHCRSTAGKRSVRRQSSA